MRAKIVLIDLKQPVPSIYIDARYHRLNLVVCWGYQPLGLLQINCPDIPYNFSPEFLKRKILDSLGWQVWEQAVCGALDEINQLNDEMLPPISVVVCTRDRALSLSRCLKVLEGLDYPDYEVVVVDNCSQDPAVKNTVIESGFRYVREDRPGLDWARNRGIKEASYDLIAFIDDDALASPGWLRGLAYGFRDPAVMAVTGLVLPAEIETSAQNDFEIYGGMSKGFKGMTFQRDQLPDHGQFWASSMGVGTNMAFRRALIKMIGDFDIALDAGTNTNGGGDIELFYRVISAGVRLRYEPAAMVHHVHRRDEDSLRRQIFNNGRSFPAYLLTIARNDPSQRLRVFWFGLRGWLWRWLVKRLLKSLLVRDKRTLGMVLTELQGAFTGPIAYWRSQKISRKVKII